MSPAPAAVLRPADAVNRTDGTTILGADDKSGVAGCPELLHLLRDDPELSHPTIEFVSTVGEERGLVGSRHLDVGRLQATHGFFPDPLGVTCRILVAIVTQNPEGDDR